MTKQTPSGSQKKKKKVTSACGAASPPSQPGCAERCPAVLQLDSQFPPEPMTAGCTSAPAPPPPSDAETQDLPLHGGETVNVTEELYFTHQLTLCQLFGLKDVDVHT